MTLSKFVVIADGGKKLEPKNLTPSTVPRMNTEEINEIERKTQGSIVNTGEGTWIENAKHLKYVTEWVNNAQQRKSDAASTITYQKRKSSPRSIKNMDYLNVQGI